MECRLVCPAHTNYLEMVFDFIVTGIYGNQVFSDCLVQKNKSDPWDRCAYLGKD